MGRQGIVIGLFLVTASVGLIAPGATTEHSEALHVLTATYGTDDGFEILLTIDMLPEVMDRDESTSPAYVVRQRIADWPATKWMLAEYLDEELLPFRTDFQQDCWGTPCVSIHWTHGLPGLFGLDVARQMNQRGFLQYRLGTELVAIEPHVVRTDEGTWFSIDARVLPPQHQHQWVFMGNFLFPDGSILPHRVERPGPTMWFNYTLREVNLENLLPSIDRPTHAPDPVPARPRQGFMFPGEDDDTFSIGADHSSVVSTLIRDDHLFGPSELTEAWVAGACLAGYMLSPAVEQVDPVEDPLGFLAKIIAESGHVKFALKVRDEARVVIGGGPFTSQTPVTAMKDIYTFSFEYDRPCPPDPGTSWPAMHLDDALGWADLYLGDRHPFMGIMFWPIQFSVVPTSASYGWNSYVVLYEPQDSEWPAYSVELSADRWELVRMVIPAADISFPPQYPATDEDVRPLEWHATGMRLPQGDLLQRFAFDFHAPFWHRAEAATVTPE